MFKKIASGKKRALDSKFPGWVFATLCGTLRIAEERSKSIIVGVAPDLSSSWRTIGGDFQGSGWTKSSMEAKPL